MAFPGANYRFSPQCYLTEL